MLDHDFGFLDWNPLGLDRFKRRITFGELRPVLALVFDQSQGKRSKIRGPGVEVRAQLLRADDSLVPAHV